MFLKHIDLTRLCPPTLKARHTHKPVGEDLIICALKWDWKMRSASSPESGRRGGGTYVKASQLYIFFMDEWFHFQFSFPELWVVMRNYWGELFQGMNGLGWPADSQETHNSTKTGSSLAGPPRKPKLIKPTSNTIITILVTEKKPDCQRKQADWWKSFRLET